MVLHGMGGSELQLASPSGTGMHDPCLPAECLAGLQRVQAADLKSAGCQVAVLRAQRCCLCDGEHGRNHAGTVQLALALGQLAAAELQEGVEVLHSAGVRLRPPAAWVRHACPGLHLGMLQLFGEACCQLAPHKVTYDFELCLRTLSMSWKGMHCWLSSGGAPTCLPWGHGHWRALAARGSAQNCGTV